MAFCPNCGSQASGAFCRNCGSPLGSGGRTSTGASLSGSQGIGDNIASMLCYIPFLVGILCAIVLLFVEPYSRNRIVRFHALQSLFLHGAIFLLFVALQVIVALLAVITHGLGILLIGFYPVLSFATLVLFLVMMYQAFMNKRTKLPIVGDLAEKQV